MIVYSPSLAAEFSFDDIEFWVGSGENRAALVIDWVEVSTEPPALAWGYRWDGEASGRDMLLAIVIADHRLFAKFDDPRDYEDGVPGRLYGLGYDADNDGEFGVQDTSFDEHGITYSSSAPFFPAAKTDPGDYYAEGWTFAFWHYGVEQPVGANPYDDGHWSDTNDGMASRDLVGGAWNSWAFTPTFDFSAFADNPIAAPSPHASPGDFNGDAEVDDRDYAVWKTSFGSTSVLAADANGNQIVDAADYVIWRKYAAPVAGFGASSSVMAPEPAAIFLCLWPLLIPVRSTLRQRKEGVS